jgi:predicted ATPase
VDQVKRLAAEVTSRRLVTLVGPGGVGKTRLSIEAAAAAAVAFPDGVWLCELAPLAEPESVVHAVLAVLSVRPNDGLEPLAALVDALSRRRLLLLIDNAEHVVRGVAELVAAVLAGAAGVALLVTSREPLAVAGEQVWPVPALDTTSEGVELFCDRAALADASFFMSEADAPVVAGICERLDGSPLAIELAAARVRSFTVLDLAERLKDRFRLLRGGRGGIERHQTLRAAIDWSYRLLDSDQQLIFERLSVFAGSFDRPAVEAVCCDEPLNPLDAADLVDSLVDRSLIIVDRHGDRARYRLLETLRQYGAECVEQRGDVERLRDRHLAHFVEAASRARVLHHGGGDDGEGAATFKREWDNIRAALGWAVETRDAPLASILVIAPFWFAVSMLHHELGVFAQQALQVVDVNPAVHGVAGLFAMLAGDLDAGEAHGRAGVAAAPSPTHPDTVICWQAIVSCDAYLNRLDRIGTDIEHWAAAADAVADPYTAAAEHAWLALFPADPGLAARHVAVAKRLGGSIAEPNLAAFLATVDGGATFAAGHRAEAASLFRQARLLAEHAGPHTAAQTAWQIALRAGAREFDVEPAGAYQEAIRRLYQLDEWANLWGVLESLATWLARSGRLDPAALILRHLEASGHRNVFLAGRRAATERLLDGATDPPIWRTRRGRLDRDRLVAYCLAQLSDGDEQTTNGAANRALATSTTVHVSEPAS